MRSLHHFLRTAHGQLPLLYHPTPPRFPDLTVCPHPHLLPHALEPHITFTPCAPRATTRRYLPPQFRFVHHLPTTAHFPPPPRSYGYPHRFTTTTTPPPADRRMRADFCLAPVTHAATRPHAFTHTGRDRDTTTPTHRVPLPQATTTPPLPLSTIPTPTMLPCTFYSQLGSPTPTPPFQGQVPIPHFHWALTFLPTPLHLCHTLPPCARPSPLIPLHALHWYLPYLCACRFRTGTVQYLLYPTTHHTPTPLPVSPYYPLWFPLPAPFLPVFPLAPHTFAPLPYPFAFLPLRFTLLRALAMDPCGKRAGVALPLLPPPPATAAAARAATRTCGLGRYLPHSRTRLYACLPRHSYHHLPPTSFSRMPFFVTLFGSLDVVTCRARTLWTCRYGDYGYPTFPLTFTPHTAFTYLPPAPLTFPRDVGWWMLFPASSRTFGLPSPALHALALAHFLLLPLRFVLHRTFPLPGHAFTRLVPHFIWFLHPHHCYHLYHPTTFSSPFPYHHCSSAHLLFGMKKQPCAFLALPFHFCTFTTLAHFHRILRFFHLPATCTPPLIAVPPPRLPTFGSHPRFWFMIWFFPFPLWVWDIAPLPFYLLPVPPPPHCHPVTALHRSHFPHTGWFGAGFAFAPWRL